MRKILISTAIVFAIAANVGIGNANEVLTNTDLQMTVLKQVLDLMNEEFDSTKPLPKIVDVTTLSNDYFMDTWGFEVIFKETPVNHYHWTDNTIALQPNADIDNLAHEYTHYVQDHYQGYDFADKSDPYALDYTETEAITIQNNFK